MKLLATAGFALIAALAGSPPSTVLGKSSLDTFGPPSVSKGAAPASKPSATWGKVNGPMRDGGHEAKAATVDPASGPIVESPLSPEHAEVAGKKGAQEVGTSSAITPLAARDVIERLKTIRSQILLEEEMSRLLKARLTRMQLERQVEEAGGPVPSPVKGKKGRSAAAPLALPPEPDATQDLIVKAVTVRPFKEAIVTYRGRVYTVRPGDQLGPLTVKDVTESGLITTGGSGPRNLPLGR
jgi:hypothetical protein